MLQLTTNAMKELSSLRAGEPLNQTGLAHVTIDFETKSRGDLGELGAFKYSCHESTEVLCLAYDIGDGVDRIWHPFLSEMPQDLFDAIESGRPVHAHNAEFEYCIWNNVCVPKLKWPFKLTPQHLRCNAAQAAVLSMPRKLEKLCAALDSPHKKDMEGNRHMLRMSKPKKPSKKDPSEWLEKLDDFERLFDYCIDDLRAEKSTGSVMPPLSIRAQRLWELTVKINERGIFCDTRLCEIALGFAQKFGIELQQELFEVTNGTVQTAKQLEKIKNFLRIHGVFAEDLTKDTVAELLKAKNMTAAAKRVLEIRQSLAKSSITKYNSMIAMAGVDSRIRGTLLFSGATTGRYSGRGIQPQNYPKPAQGMTVETVFKCLEFGDYGFFKTVYPDVYEALAAALRGMLRAAPGKILRVADFSAIEARIIVWLAGDDLALEAYHNNEDSYIEMAALLYRISVSKVTKFQREVGKRIVLGCGFGMGWEKFHRTCVEDYGLDIEVSLAKRAVELYRKKYYLVKKFWYDLERAAIMAVKNPGRRVDFRNLQWLHKGQWLFCQLPSGRRISYYQPEIRTEETDWGIKDGLTFMAEDSKTRQWVRERTYGGKLAENVTQAVAADVMTDSMFRVESKNYSVILTVHDEVGTEDDVDFGSLKEFAELMSVVPKWGKGLPIKVGSYEAERYRK